VVREVDGDSHYVSPTGIPPSRQFLTPDSSRLWVCAVSIKPVFTAHWHLVDESVTVTFRIHELASHDARLWLVIHEPHDLDG